MTRGVQDDGRLLTRIHGKYYDLTAFEFVHPGGRTAINCARDRDGTGLFESYHLLSIDKARKTLAPYEIKDGSFDASTRFLDVKKMGNELKFDWLVKNFSTGEHEGSAQRKPQGLARWGRVVGMHAAVPAALWGECAARALRCLLATFSL
jgi:hypothetical protein